MSFICVKLIARESFMISQNRIKLSRIQQLFEPMRKMCQSAKVSFWDLCIRVVRWSVAKINYKVRLIKKCVVSEEV